MLFPARDCSANSMNKSLKYFIIYRISRTYYKLYQNIYLNTILLESTKVFIRKRNFLYKSHVHFVSYSYLFVSNL